MCVRACANNVWHPSILERELTLMSVNSDNSKSETRKPLDLDLFVLISTEANTKT